MILATILFFIAHGTSMLPAVREGDTGIGAADYAHATKRDHVAFVPQGRWTKEKVVWHRIVGGWPGKYVTRGDNSTKDDPGYLTPKNYVATITYVIHRKLSPPSRS